LGLIRRFRYWKYSRRFADYRPQAVTVERLDTWVRQFSERDAKAILTLLDRVIYLNEPTVEKILVDQNRALVDKLRRAGIPAERIVYMSLHDAGSSSPVMLNLLRDGARLERRGSPLIDGNNSLRLHEVTNELGEGAIVYVDDFSGTGRQFCETRKFVSQSIVGNFSEFLLVPCLCEEAVHRLGKDGIDFYTGLVHTRAERPLHENSTILDPQTKDRLRQISLGIHSRMGMGFSGLATNVILYRNAPNTTPLLIRGNLDQKAFVGIFPRTTDLPIAV
jgi:hypothetical protein